LPEPGPATLQEQFDEDLEAVEAALRHESYELVNFDLPWLEGAARETTHLSLDKAIEIDQPTLSASGASRPVLELKPSRDPHAEQARAEYQPGVMLFRQIANETTDLTPVLLVLFVIGETPTRGVNRTTLRDALDQIAWLSGLKNGDPKPPVHLAQLVAGSKSDDPIHIVGPLFSGSVESIEATLDEWRENLTWAGYRGWGVPTVPRIGIISGSATAVSGGSFYSSELPIDFSTFAHP
jgi:hypothetical protein